MLLLPCLLPRRAYLFSIAAMSLSELRILILCQHYLYFVYTTLKIPPITHSRELFFITHNSTVKKSRTSHYLTLYYQILSLCLRPQPSTYSMIQDYGLTAQTRDRCRFLNEFVEQALMPLSRAPPHVNPFSSA